MCRLCHRFILENFVLDKHVRFILTIYPVVIWALTGVFMKNYNAEDPDHNDIFIGECWCLYIFCFHFPSTTANTDQFSQYTNKAFSVNYACLYCPHSYCICNIWHIVCTLTLPSAVPPAVVSLLAIACALFVGRVFLVIWRQIKYPLYEDVNPEAMSPMDIAEMQRKIFKWAMLTEYFSGTVLCVWIQCGSCTSCTY